jgi:hypothetical protein
MMSEISPPSSPDANSLVSGLFLWEVTMPVSTMTAGLMTRSVEREVFFLSDFHYIAHDFGKVKKKRVFVSILKR